MVSQEFIVGVIVVVCLALVLLLVSRRIFGKRQKCCDNKSVPKNCTDCEGCDLFDSCNRKP